MNIEREVRIVKGPSRRVVWIRTENEGRKEEKENEITVFLFIIKY